MAKQDKLIVKGWEMLFNPIFKPHIYEGFKIESAKPHFWMSAQKWINKTNAIGITSKSGRYNVDIMHVNQAVKRNPDKFPEGYIICLTENEKKEVITNCDNPKIKFSPALPNAFTEKGLYMLATILKSERASFELNLLSAIKIKHTSKKELK